MSDVELNNKMRLNQARRDMEKEKAEAQARKTVKKSVRRVGPVALARKAKDMASAPMAIRVTDLIIYGAAFALAFFKDLLDLALLGSLPGIGTVITWCISMTIGLILMFDGISSGRRKVANGLIKKLLVLIAGTMVEGFIFGLNFIPFEMITVGIIYWMTLVERRGQKRIINENNEYD